MKSKVFYILLPAFMTVLLITCNTIENEDTQSIALNSIFNESSGKAETDSTVSVDSILITDARFCMNDIKLKTSGEKDSTLFKSGPFVLDLDITGKAQQVNLVDVEPVTYETIEYDIIVASPGVVEQLPEEERTEFSDFAGTSEDDSYSVIIDGIVFIDSTLESFTYKSRININRIDSVVKNILVYEGAGTINATMLFDPYYWFRDTAAGNVYNPAANLTRDQVEVIDSNLIKSITVFRDRNRDGKLD